MNIRLFRLNFNDKDLFVLIFGIFLFLVHFTKISITPFRFESLIVVFLFLLTTRSLIENSKFGPYLIIADAGLILSTFLSPYGLLIFYILALIIYKKTHFLN